MKSAQSGRKPRGTTDNARKEYLVAYDCYHVARYPAPNSPGKRAAYRKSQENLHKAARYFDPRLSGWRCRSMEDRRGNSVVRSSAQTEKWFTPAGRGDLGRDRCVQGRAAERSLLKSGLGDARHRYAGRGRRAIDRDQRTASGFGMRYSTTSRAAPISTSNRSAFTVAALAVTGQPKLRTRITNVCARRSIKGVRLTSLFSADWIVKAQRGEYPFELAETLACAFDRSSGEEWIEYAPKLSLLTQGILGKTLRAAAVCQWRE